MSAERHHLKLSGTGPGDYHLTIDDIDLTPHVAGMALAIDHSTDMLPEVTLTLSRATTVEVDLPTTLAQLVVEREVEA